MSPTPSQGVRAMRDFHRRVLNLAAGAACLGKEIAWPSFEEISSNVVNAILVALKIRVSGRHLQPFFWREN